MEIVLKPERQQFIPKQIANGQFSSTDEAVNAALLLLEKLQHEYAEWIEETRQKVDEAIAELDRCEGLDSDIVIGQILQRFQAAREIKH